MIYDPFAGLKIGLERIPSCLFLRFDFGKNLSLSKSLSGLFSESFKAWGIFSLTFINKHCSRNDSGGGEEDRVGSDGMGWNRLTREEVRGEEPRPVSMWSTRSDNYCCRSVLLLCGSGI